MRALALTLLAAAALSACAAAEPPRPALADAEGYPMPPEEALRPVIAEAVVPYLSATGVMRCDVWITPDGATLHSMCRRMAR